MALIPDPDAMRERWARLQRWEDEQLWLRPRPFAEALAWLASARQLARRMDSDWGSPARAETHWRELGGVQRALAKVRFRR